MLHQIGAGALGPVFRASDAAHERLVAVKRFALDLTPDRMHVLVAEFERLVAARVAHPVAVTALATGTDGLVVYLVHQLVAADSLDVVIRDHGVAPAADALRVATDLAGALDVAAAAGVHHGALHPRDVLLGQGETWLTGLGIARAIEAAGATTPVRRPYTAPERRSGQPWDRRADVFSLAALTHDMLWGRRIAGLGEEAAQSLTDLPGADLALLRAAFARAMAAVPGRRFVSAGDFVAALTRAFPGVVVTQPAVAGSAGPLVAAGRLPSLAPKAQGAAAAHAAFEELSFMRPSDDAVKPEELALRFADDPQSETAARVAGFDETAPPLVPVPLRSPRGEDVRPTRMRPRAIEPYRPKRALSQPPRGSVWSLSAALSLGLVCGFGGGYIVGRRHRSSALATATTPTRLAPPAPGAAAESTAGAGAVSPLPAADGARAGAGVVGKEAVSAPAESSRAGSDGPSSGPSSGASSGPSNRPSNGLSRAPSTTDASASSSVALPEGQASALRGGAKAAAVATLEIRSRPEGAKVLLDGSLVGTTPLTVPRVTAGEHTVRLEHPGYRRWSLKLRLGGGRRRSITAALQK